MLGVVQVTTVVPELLVIPAVGLGFTVNADTAEHNTPHPPEVEFGL